MPQDENWTNCKKYNATYIFVFFSYLSFFNWSCIIVMPINFFIILPHSIQKGKLCVGKGKVFFRKALRWRRWFSLSLRSHHLHTWASSLFGSTRKHSAKNILLSQQKYVSICIKRTCLRSDGFGRFFLFHPRVYKTCVNKYYIGHKDWKQHSTAIFMLNLFRKYKWPCSVRIFCDDKVSHNCSRALWCDETKFSVFTFAIKTLAKYP